MLKLPLKRRKTHQLFVGKTLSWASCLPFVENDRGLLIHRPRQVTQINIHLKPHIAIQYWCGNGVARGRGITFLSEPPKDTLLCESCEERAVAAQLPSAFSLAGRHVHVGRLKAIRTCCHEITGDEA